MRYSVKLKKDVIRAVEEFIDYYNNFKPKAFPGGMSHVEYKRRNSRSPYPAKIDQSMINSANGL